MEETEGERERDRERKREEDGFRYLKCALFLYISMGKRSIYPAVEKRHIYPANLCGAVFTQVTSCPGQVQNFAFATRERKNWHLKTGSQRKNRIPLFEGPPCDILVPHSSTPARPILGTSIATSQPATSRQTKSHALRPKSAINYGHQAIDTWSDGNTT